MYNKKSVSNFNISDYDETHVFQLAHPSLSNTLTSKETGQPILFPPSLSISSVDRIINVNEDSGQLEEKIIAYRPGFSSIFVNDGEDLQALTENRNRSLGDIEFVHGYLRVSGRQVLLLDFLRKCNKNATNKNRDKNVTLSYFEVNHEEAIQSLMDNEERDIDIITFCTKGDFEDVRSLARSIGINVNQPVIQVRYDLRTFAMRSEETKQVFMRSLRNPSVKRKATVLDAIENEILFFNKSNNTLTWKNGGSITTAPVGKDAVDYFVDNSFNNVQGEGTYAEIYNQLNDLKNPSAPITINEDLADLTAYKNDPMGTIIRLAKIAGFIEQKGAYINYNGSHFRKSDFIKHLDENPELLQEFKVKLLPKEALN